MPTTPLASKLGMQVKPVVNVPMTCPVRPRLSDFDFEQNEELMKKLENVRRKSLQFRPKFSSPLSKYRLAITDV